jgi:hypothetical protein
LGQAAHGHRFVPGLVGVDDQIGLAFQRAGEVAHARHVGLRRLRADLNLEGAVQARVELGARLVHFLRGVAGGERPEHGDAVPHRAAEQGGGRQPERLADRVEQRGLDRGLGGVVALGGLVQADPGGLEQIGALADDRRGQIGVDVGLHGLDALLAPARAAEGGGLADPLDAVGEPHLDEDVVLRRHRGVGQLVLTHRRHVDDGAPHLANREIAAQVRGGGRQGVEHGKPPARMEECWGAALLLVTRPPCGSAAPG